ncbi:MAG: alpha/beta hydrolase [Oscillospiraceae bacterium]
MSKINFMLQVEDCKLNVTDVENKNSDTVVVVLHGGPGSGAQPVMDLPAFQELEKSFSMIYFDQRGSGNSEYALSKKLSIEQITDDVKAVVDYAKEKYKGKHICLWGGSFGGLLGLLFMQRYENAVEKAVFSSPSICPGRKEDATSQFRFFKEVFSKLLPTDILNKTAEFDENTESLSNFLSMTELTQWLAENKVIEGCEGFWHGHAMRDWFFNCDMRYALKDIKIKTLFLVGEEDPVLPSASLIDAVKKFNNPLIELKVYSPCGHAVFEDCKDEFCKECVRYYEN